MDALWARSRSGLVVQAADYGGELRAVYASPPSLTVVLLGLPVPLLWLRVHRRSCRRRESPEPFPVGGRAEPGGGRRGAASQRRSQTLDGFKNGSFVNP